MQSDKKASEEKTAVSEGLVLIYCSILQCFTNHLVINKIDKGKIHVIS